MNLLLRAVTGSMLWAGLLGSLHAESQPPPTEASTPGVPELTPSFRQMSSHDVSPLKLQERPLDEILAKINDDYHKAGGKGSLRYASKEGQAPPVMKVELFDGIGTLCAVDYLTFDGRCIPVLVGEDIVLVPQAERQAWANEGTILEGPLGFLRAEVYLDPPNPGSHNRPALAPLKAIPTRFRMLMAHAAKGAKLPDETIYVNLVAQRLALSNDPTIVSYLFDNIGWQERATNSGDWTLGSTAPVYRALALLGPERLPELATEWVQERLPKWEAMPPEESKRQVGKLFLVGDLLQRVAGPAAHAQWMQSMKDASKATTK